MCEKRKKEKVVLLEASQELPVGPTQQVPHFVLDCFGLFYDGTIIEHTSLGCVSERTPSKTLSVKVRH